MTPGAARTGTSFALTKWYFDCVSADGSVVIGYWASLAWRTIAFTWERVDLYEPGKPPLQRSALSLAPPPDVDRERIRWHAPALGCEFELGPRHPAIEQRLLDDARGVVDWRAEAPAAAASVTLHGHAPIRGNGYAECLRLTLPPWRLPIRELRWGRWIADDRGRSVVWIDWRGEQPRTWAFVDGRLTTPAVVSDDVLSAGTATLAIGARRTLEAVRFSKVAETIPPLRGVLPTSMLGFHQTRWCSAAELRDGDAPAVCGSVIHEVVVW